MLQSAQFFHPEVSLQNLNKPLTMQQSLHQRRTSLHRNFLLPSYPSNAASTEASAKKMISSLKSLEKKPNGPHRASGFQALNKSCYHPSSFNSISEASYPVKISKRLTSLKDLPLKDTFSIAVKLIKEFSVVMGKKNDALLNPDELWITHSGNVLVLTEFPQNSKNQYFRPTTHQQTKIGREIVSLLEAVSCKKFEDFHTYYQRSLSKHPDCNFKRLIGLIRSYCVCAKIDLPDIAATDMLSSLKPVARTISSYQTKQRKMKTEVSPCSSKQFTNKSEKQNLGQNTLQVPKLKFTKSEVDSPLFIKQRRKISITVEGEEQKNMVSSFSNQTDFINEGSDLKLQPKTCKVFSNGCLKVPLQEHQKRTRFPRESIDTFKDSVASTNKSSAHFGSFMRNSFEGGPFSFDSEKEAGEEEKKSLLRPFSFAPSNLEEVLSQEGSTSEIGSPQPSSQKIEIRLFSEGQQKLVQQNWAFNLESLMKPEKKNEVQQSIIVGKQPSRRDSKVEKLDKMVHLLCESMTEKELLELQQSQ